MGHSPESRRDENKIVSPLSNLAAQEKTAKLARDVRTKQKMEQLEFLLPGGMADTKVPDIKLLTAFSRLGHGGEKRK